MEQTEALISQGSEACVYKTTFLNLAAIRKYRLPKKYRNTILDDRIIRKNILSEARALYRCRMHGLEVPSVYFVDLLGRSIYLEYVPGIIVRNFLNSQKLKPDNDTIVAKLGYRIGRTISKMHELDIIHGDLTTSNMLIRDDTSNICLIDFGLASKSPLIEDKAVDLLVVEKTANCIHNDFPNFLVSIYKGYFEGNQSAKSIERKIKEVRLRGRKHLELS